MGYQNIMECYVQGEGDEEGCWHLHNAMRDESGVAYHPECFKVSSSLLSQLTNLERDLEIGKSKTTFFLIRSS
jgi:hypothetical protein